MTPRDWLARPAHQRGFFGSKPPEFVRWVLDCMGVTRDDEFIDLFPGSGAVTQEYECWRNQTRLTDRTPFVDRGPRSEQGIW